MPNQRSEFCIQVGSSGWRIELPTYWADSFLALMRHVLVSPKTTMHAELNGFDMSTARRKELEVIRRGLPADAILFRKEAKRQHYITSETWSVWDEQSLKGTFMIKEKPGSVLLGTNLFSHFFIWASGSLGYTPVHAACSGMHGAYALMPASAGRGKSTIAWGAYLHGLDVVTDDFCFLHTCRHSLQATGPYACIKLNQDSIDMGLWQTKTPHPVVFYEKDDAKKIFFPSWNSTRPFAGHGSLKYLFVPHRNGRCPTINSASFKDVLPHLSSSYQLVRNAKGDIKCAFRNLNRILRRLPVYEFSLGPSLHENMNFLMEWWSK